MPYISYPDLEIEQKKDLDYKIGTLKTALQSGFDVCRHRPALAFSGGKDSTVLWDAIRRFFPEWISKILIIYGNTGNEYPQSLSFSRQMGQEWGNGNFYEALPAKTEKEGLKYKAQQEVLEYIIREGLIQNVLKDDGKLKNTNTIDRYCPNYLREKFRQENLIWKEGTRQSYWWCADQYGYPLLGKSFSKLKAHRINIDCFLRFSKSQSEDKKLLKYYRILREVKISQACCDILKKEPSENLQAELDVDVIFKGLMAAESRTRQTNFITRGYLFKSWRPHLGADPFWHCNPLSIWTDDDIWEYIHRYNVPYSSLYDMGWTDQSGTYHKIPRNGCMGCGTDLAYANNHLAMLRRTHPKQWNAYMRLGLAEQIQKLRIQLNGGQISIMDVFDTDRLILERPCVFDTIGDISLDDNTWNEGDTDEFDPEAA
jgi:3'-phosphoadenosine 5'-phosphosulfate sulfotransferase (PAPS reductase)/FAD synthetase